MMKVFEENTLQQMRVLMEILVPLLYYYISQIKYSFSQHSNLRLVKTFCSHS